MKFSKSVAILALAMFVCGAVAETTEQSSAPTASASQSASAQATPETTVNVDVNASPTVTTAPNMAPVAPVAPAQLEDAKAQELRKARETVEHKNDDKVVEKLEKTRLDDEKEISKKIDQTTLNPADPNSNKDANKPVVIEKVEVIQPSPQLQQPVILPPPPQEVKEIKKEEEKKHEWYAGVGTGSVLYNGNVTDKSNLSVVAGKMIDEHLAVEGIFTYSSFNLNNYWGGVITNALFGEMEQYDFAGGIKYYVLTGESRFKPFVGAYVDYIYREYKDRYDYGYYYSYNNYTNSQNTNSLNATISGGIDVNITDRIVIGGQINYSMPLYYEDNGLITQGYVDAYSKPLEQTYFTSWSINLKYLF